MHTHSRFDNAKQRYVMTDTRPPANAFEWKRYVVEEAERRDDTGELNANETSRKRSMASSKAVERNRLGAVQQANIAGMSKHEMDTYLTPKKFHVYNQARKKSNL